MTPRYYQLQDEISSIDKETERILSEKAYLDNLIKEKDHDLENARKEFDQSDKKKVLTDQVKQLKEQVREHIKKEKEYETQTQKSNEIIIALEEKYRVVLEKTGYNPEEDRIIQQTKWDPKKLDALKRKKKVMDMAWKPNSEDAKEEDDDDGGPVIVPSKFDPVRPVLPTTRQ